MDSEIRQKFADIQKSITWPVYLFDYQGKCIDANNLDKIGEKVDVPDIPNGQIVKTGQFRWITVGSQMGVNTYYIALFGSDEGADGAILLIKLMFNEGSKEIDRHTVLRSMLFDDSGTAYSIEDIESIGLPVNIDLRVIIIDHKGASFDETKVICENIIENAIVVEVDRFHMAVIAQELEGLDDILQAIISEMNTELLIPAHAGVGKSVISWPLLHESYRCAKSALSLGKKLGDEKTIFYYDQMMIFHLMNEVDERSRKQYFNDYGTVFKELVQDEELIQTALRFFENDLNITETSRQLYVHRNTLIYRLNKIEKQAGLDLRSFDDAMQFFMLMLIWRLGNYTEE